MRSLRVIAAIAMLGGTASAQPGATDGAPAPPPDAYPPPPPDGSQQPPPPDLGPPPSQGSRVTFVSSNEQRWDIRLDDQAVCTTPCAIPIESMRFITLHSHDVRPTRLKLGYLPPGDHVVTAQARANGLFATGVTFTTLGGAAVVTGITLTAVGCSTDRDGMCRAGLITGGVGLLVTAGSIRMIQRSLPRLHVGPASATPYVASNHVGLAGSF